jgi:glycosyltransferase involved in cell wall biosynthesis
MTRRCSELAMVFTGRGAAWYGRLVLPLVSVLVPVYNEERHIERCLGALARQNYSRERFEVLVIDGGSTDRTLALVTRAIAEHGMNARVFHNPRRHQAAALNIGLENAHGDVIVRVDGHAFPAPDFISASVAALDRTGADCVGGPIQSVGETFVGKAIASAMSSRFGVGGASFRLGETGTADTVAFGAYRRDVFERLGVFAEELKKGEDAEFNYRLRDAGGRIMLCPEIRVSYIVRGSLPALFRQYFGYGRSKPEIIMRHPRQARPRHLVPTAAVTGTLLLALAAPLIGWLPLMMLGAVYVAFLAAGATYLAVRWRAWGVALVPLVLVCMHVSYGLGSLWGAAALPFTRWKRRETRVAPALAPAVHLREEAAATTTADPPARLQ